MASEALTHFTIMRAIPAKQRGGRHVPRPHETAPAADDTASLGS